MGEVFIRFATANDTDLGIEFNGENIGDRIVKIIRSFKRQMKSAMGIECSYVQIRGLPYIVDIAYINTKNNIQTDHNNKNRSRFGYAFIELKDRKDFEIALSADLKKTIKNLIVFKSNKQAFLRLMHTNVFLGLV